jgi:hypothetical protein
MPNTPLHNWQYPDIDQNNWGPILQTLYGDIDADTPVIDTLTNRPAASAANVFIQTDDAGDGPGVYVSDGSSWALATGPVDAVLDSETGDEISFAYVTDGSTPASPSSGVKFVADDS